MNKLVILSENHDSGVIISIMIINKYKKILNGKIHLKIVYNKKLAINNN